MNFVRWLTVVHFSTGQPFRRRVRMVTDERANRFIDTFVEVAGD